MMSPSKIDTQLDYQTDSRVSGETMRISGILGDLWVDKPKMLDSAHSQTCM